MSLVGDLSTMGLPDLLQWLAAAGKIGTLQVERRKVRRWIQLSQGQVVGCSSDDPPHRLGQYLLSREMITEEQLRQALCDQRESRKHLGAILVGRGIISQADLTAHLESKAEETIYSLFDWNDGVFRFEEGLQKRRNIFSVGLPVQDILLRGLKRFDEMTRIREVFHDPGIVLRYTATPPGPEIFSNRMARAMYSTIDGNRSITEILLQVHGSEYMVYKFLYELFRNGFVEIAGVKSLDAPAPFETHPGTRQDPAGGRDDDEPMLEQLALEDPSSVAEPHASASPSPPTAESLRTEGSVATAVAPAPEDPAAATGLVEVIPRSLEAQLGLARRHMADGDSEAALDILDALYREHPGDDALRRLTAEAEATFVDRAYRHLVPADKVPVLTRPVESLASEAVSPHDFFLLSRIDGTWDVRSIIQIAPFREVDALRTLKRMRESGLIRLKDPQD